MGVIVKSDSTPREMVPAGSYFGVLAGMYDLGTQASGEYGPKHQFLFVWELHKRKGPARDGQGNVLTINNYYNLVFTPKANLRCDIEAMLGRAFTAEQAKEGIDIETLLGTPCRIQVVHTEKQDGGTKEKIKTITPLDEDDDRPRPVLPPAYFEIGADRTIPDSVPEWIAKIIRKSKEFGGPAGGAPNGRPAAAEDDDEDIPF
jgi:hypothetical protein